MSRPTVLPDWATNGTYGAGPFAGQPNKAVAPAGNIAEGFDPGSGIPAEWLNERISNHAQWIDYQDVVARVRDDFVDATSTLANRYTISDSASGTHAVVDDSASGAFGALKQDGSASGTDSSQAQSIIGAGVGTGDFRLRMPVRLTNTNGTTTAEYGLRQSTVNRITVVLFAGSLHWGVKVDLGTVVVSSSVVASSSYQLLEISRFAGVIYVKANGTQIYTAADTANRSGLQLWAFTQSAIGYVDYFDFISDR